MSRYIRYLILIPIAIALVTLALANRTWVDVTLLPDAMSRLFGFQFAVSLPLFLVVFGSMIIGLIIGFGWEWMREHKHRSDAASRAREIARLERELKQLRQIDPAGQDDVLALLAPSDQAK